MSHQFSDIKAILIDLDDTILGDDVYTEQAWNTACYRFISNLGRINFQELYAAIRESGGQYWQDPENHRRGRLNLSQARREVVKLAFAQLGLKNDITAENLADAYTAEKEKLIAPLPGALETIKTIKSRGLGLALLTNGGADTQRRKIERFGLAPFFDHIFIEGEFGVGKPDARVFQAALRSLKVSAGEAWMIGDDLNRDVAGAQKSGIFGVWVDWRQNGLPSSASVKPDCIVNRISELLDKGLL